MRTLECQRGDTNRYSTPIVAPVAGVSTPVNLDTVAKIWFTVKREWDDADAAAVIQKTLGDGIVVSAPASAGIAVITISSAETAALSGLQRLVFDVQILESNGNVTTVDKGYFQIVRDATKATV